MVPRFNSLCKSLKSNKSHCPPKVYFNFSAIQHLESETSFEGEKWYFYLFIEEKKRFGEADNRSSNISEFYLLMLRMGDKFRDKLGATWNFDGTYEKLFVWPSPTEKSTANVGTPSSTGAVLTLSLRQPDS